MSSQPPSTPFGAAPGSEMSVVCPHCQARLNLPASQAGTVVTCPQCSGKFQVPLPTAHVGGAAYPGAYPSSPEVAAFAGKKIAAGICGILLGGLGVHKFILGLNTAGIIMLAVTLAGAITTPCLIVPVLAPLAMSAIGLVEGILYLIKNDDEFYQTYAIQKKQWF